MDSESSDEEGDGICGYVGEPVLSRADVRDLGESIVGGPLVDREEGTDDSLEVSEQNERDISSDCPSSLHKCSDDYKTSIASCIIYGIVPISSGFQKSSGERVNYIVQSSSTQVGHWTNSQSHGYYLTC